MVATTACTWRSRKSPPSPPSFSAFVLFVFCQLSLPLNRVRPNTERTTGNTPDLAWCTDLTGNLFRACYLDQSLLSSPSMAPPKFAGMSGKPLSLTVSTVATMGFLLFGYDRMYHPVS
ncbi:uncharacterized protein LDX57_011427 [Aspergillus melleus]|uniref:uncharacterized protein n=1 Tax=Aspergillus melleus TaxID=138277 RepID=UPI001E8DD624|nr:uncharacterized protein LDX57_011427 [Aspergillus melleus]KAH8433793.1 hypothetical protein LDX57_011427 [Aspergillus melleus]